MTAKHETDANIYLDAARWRAVREYVDGPSCDRDNIALLLCGGYLWWSGKVVATVDEAVDRLIAEQEARDGNA